LWIGCDLQNLIRDLKRFLKLAPHFSIQEVQPLDMFPQTFHIETAVLLTR
jgi:23S rRNA (uracil1939-C5)-methyltransferase